MHGEQIRIDFELFLCLLCKDRETERDLRQRERQNENSVLLQTDGVKETFENVSSSGNE